MIVVVGVIGLPWSHPNCGQLLSLVSHRYCNGKHMIFFSVQRLKGIEGEGLGVRRIPWKFRTSLLVSRRYPVHDMWGS